MKMVYTYNEFSKKAKDDNIDVFISCSSFEDRSMVIPKLAMEFEPKSRLVFFNVNEVKAIRLNAHSLLELDKERTKLIELDSDDPIQNYTKILDVVYHMVSNSKERPNIVIDTTTFTHETLLVLLRVLHLKKIGLGDIRICYVGAREYSTNVDDDKDKWLSKGVDEIRTIIGYPGYTDPTRQNHLIILFGFEFERTRQIIDEYEFDFITLGFGDEPIQNNHMKINCERHKRLLIEHPEAREIQFSLTNPIKTKEQILRYVNSKGLKRLNTVIAPLNNKLSTIGAGLAAIDNKEIQLAYAKASIYNTDGYSIPNEDIYYFKIDFSE